MSKNSIVTDKTTGPLSPMFPLKRYVHQHKNRDYYAYGNTPAADFLESCIDRRPSVLSLGCGDIRSCFYTLWKHFDDTVSNAPSRFDGVNFALLDCSAAVLARNVMFIYLALNLPQERKLRKNWLCGMWAIWYCHELCPDHMKMLSDSLKYFISFSASLDEWNCEKNSLKFLVHFTSASCLSEVSRVWNMWLNDKVMVSSIKQMQKSRKDLLNHEINNMSLFCYNYSLIGTFICGKIPVSHRLSTHASEVRSYLSSGCCFAESVFDLSLPSRCKVNLTLYEREDGIYTMHYASVPFSAFQQTFDLHPDGKSRDIFVSSKHFNDKPFLANSVQQFAMWVQSASRTLTCKSIPTKFTFYCQDALTFCHEREYSYKTLSENLKADQKFSAIYTSNLMDHTGLPNLVLSCIPLLKDKSFLFTSSLISKDCAANLDEFLKLCFGFDCTLLPALLGIRCINHEGKDYSSPVLFQPFPPDMAASEGPGPPHVRFLVWEKLSGAMPLSIPKLPTIEPGNITDGLVNLVGSCAFSHLNTGPGLSTCVVGFNTTITAVLMLHCFVNHLSKNMETDYAFWEPLCKALRHIAHPFAICLQTHIFLHNMHIHLVVTEKDCSMCKKEPMEDAIGVFSVRFAADKLLLGRSRPFLYALVHNTMSYIRSQDILTEALGGKNVHIFDSFDTSVTDDILELNFFAPLQLVHQNYKVAIVFVFARSTRVYPVIETTMAKALSSSKKYSFFQPNVLFPRLVPGNNAEFGSVVSHSYDGCKSETVIALSVAAQVALSSNKLCKQKISPCECRLFCDSLSFFLHLKYPTDLDEIDIKQSDATLLHITSKHIGHRFDDEHPHCIVSPNHSLSIPPMMENITDIIKSQSGMQFTQEESSKNLKTMIWDLPPLMRAKVTIQRIFENSTSCHFYQVINRQKSDILLIAVNALVFDYEHQTPAIDLAFSKTSRNDVIVKKWEKLFQSTGGRQELLNDAQFTLLIEVLTYFMKRTNGNLQGSMPSTTFSDLSSMKIDHFFSRAVLYFLLCDPDKKILVPNLPFVPPAVSGAYCNNCRTFSFTLKMCIKCKQTQYCSKDCQRSHWKIHRQDCRKASSEVSSTDVVSSLTGFFSEPVSDHKSSSVAEKFPECSYCKKESNILKKCTRCRAVQYCNIDCQRNHWSKHKIDCTKN